MTVEALYRRTVIYLRTHITVLHPLATEFFMELDGFDEFHVPPTGRHEPFKCCMCHNIFHIFRNMLPSLN